MTLKLEDSMSCSGGCRGSREVLLAAWIHLPREHAAGAIAINPNQRAVPEQGSSESERVGSPLGKVNTTPSVRKDLHICSQPQLVCR